MVNPPISVQPKDHSRIKLATSSIDIQWNIPSYPKYHLSYLIISHYSTRRVLCLSVELPTTNFHLSSVQHELRHPFDLFIGNPILDYDNPNIRPLFHQIHQGQPGSTRVNQGQPGSADNYSFDFLWGPGNKNPALSVSTMEKPVTMVTIHPRDPRCFNSLASSSPSTLA